MTRFFLHYHDSVDRLIDPDGMELPDLAAARAEAIAAAREIIAGEVQSGVVNLSAWIDVEDETGEVLETVRFTDAVRIISAEAQTNA